MFPDLSHLGYSNFQAFMLQVKTKIQVKIFEPRLILYILCLLALIHERKFRINLGLKILTSI